ncbi:CheR family methyltransferase [Algoriphagus yeomjeoni]|uniref:histidine kinase n=1 Tax=Algoriphagus yeomjeoni TaxID=291403 RepID=A0A327PPH5_9BACT|nr:CheR family methyltransferase [Algoriphagus yeomjeoni]RAI91566.1 two-component system CheB/CheR fusion protein [Algoriphagus yeomjeoni]
MKDKIKFPIIALGASAGGLEPLELFFEKTADDPIGAYVVIQHLAPNHKSLMDELLARHTKLPIYIIEDGMSINPGAIYLNPPKKFVEIRNEKFVLNDKEDRKLSFPITSFFMSLAENLQDNACAIILSGTGSDGAEGLKYVKEKGGLVLVQSPDDAKFNGMPNNAIHTGVVDKVCSIEEMPQEISLFFTNRKLLIQKYQNHAEGNPVISKILKTVLELIAIDFTGYKHTTVSRRIHRRMNLLDVTKIEEYYRLLKDNPAEAHLLSKELLIGVTRFFRDEEAFEALTTEVIPKLVEENLETKTLRIWVPACSTGEEAYSLAILVKDYLRKNKLQFDVSIFATDLDKDAIKLASNRIFSENITSEVPVEILNTYFISQKGGYSIVKEIREMIVFSVHNLIQDPAFNKIDLVSCRNLLIYLNEPVQQQLFKLFQYALRTGGYLFLGPSESLGAESEEFREVNHRYKIFQNIENKKFIQRLHTAQRFQKQSWDRAPEARQIEQPLVTTKGKLQSEIQHTLIQEYVPDSMVIDQHFNLLHTSGSTHRWLRIPPGEISSNVLRMLPEVFAVPLEVAVNKVLQDGNAIILGDLAVPEDFHMHFQPNSTLDIHIRTKELLEGMRYVFITFEQVSGNSNKVEAAERINLSAVSKEKINILERELRVNRETLQTTVEELESSNEELQAANEELQSSNEELESVNEELYTVNAEYQQKNSELANNNDDLNNLIQSTEIALLFLDVNLNIRKFTPSLKKILDLVPHDIGRNISQFRGKIQLENLLDRIGMVLENQSSFESRIEDIKKREYLLKISPFRTQKDEIKGVILVFVDLTQANRLQKALEVSDNALKELNSKHSDQAEILGLISQNLRDMVCIINSAGDIEYCTPSGFLVTGYKLDKLYKLNLFKKIPVHADRLKIALKSIDSGQEPGLVEFQFQKSNKNLRWLEATVKAITLRQSEGKKYLLTIRDINHRKNAEQELQKVSLIAEQSPNAVIMTDTHGRIIYVNETFEKMTGYEECEVLNKIPGRVLQGKESDPEVVRQMAEAIANRDSFEVNIINYTKLGNKYLTHIKARPLYNLEGEFIGFFSIQDDVTTEEEYIYQVSKLNDVIKAQNKQLQDVNKSLEEFAYVASHDLKAPLRSIKGLLSIIEKKGDFLEKGKQKQYFEIINSSANEMDKMITNLLEFSRTGRLNESLEEVKLPDLFEEVLMQFSKELEDLNGKIIYNLDITEIAVYPILFKRLLTNLISNALKYRGDQNPIIQITSQSKEEKVTFAVKDNGIGIPENQLENVFKIFHSLNPNNDSNGIGLAVCRKVVELHGGKMWAESELGEGTVFKFEIAINQ